MSAHQEIVFPEAARVTREQIRMREELERTRALADYWTIKLLPGQKIIEKVSGMTGEIYKIHVWGVEVWLPMLGNTRQNWTWPMLATRFPRKIKRYPRPFRFPREEPTQCCHCKMGRMEVIGENQVRCTRCKLLVGDESFPRRIKRASSFLRKKYGEKKLPKSNRRRKVRPRVVGPKRTSSHPRKKRTAPSRMGVRPRGRKEKKLHGKNQKRGNPKIPPVSRPTKIPERDNQGRDSTVPPNPTTKEEIKAPEGGQITPS